MPRLLASLAALLVVIAACDDGSIDGPTELPVSDCNGILHSVPAEDATHMPAGTAIEWSSNPPATGAHFPTWAGWDRSYTQLDRGYWLHNAEHGGVILLYNCPEGCQDVVDELLAIARAATTDDACAAPVTKRVIVAADPLLPADVQVAAVAWTTYYTASCFDPYVATFLRTQYAHGPENTCADGVPFGGVRITPPQ